MTSESGSTHKGRNIAIGAIIGAVLVIVLILSVRAIVEKRRENAREAARTGTAVSRTTRTGATGGAAGSPSGAVGDDQTADSQPNVPSSSQDGSDSPAVPPADQPDDQVEPPPNEPDNGPIVFTPVSVVSQSVTPNPAAQADFIWCTAQIKGNAASVSMLLDGPENFNFDLSLWSTEGDITTWKYNHGAMPPGSYSYSVTATAADGTSTTVAGGTLVTTP